MTQHLHLTPADAAEVRRLAKLWQCSEAEAICRAIRQQAEQAAGFDCLVNGLAGAEELRAAGEAYATELLQRYRQELDHYPKRHDVRVG